MPSPLPAPRPRVRNREPRLRSASALITGLALASPLHATDWSWNAGNGLWTVPANWTPSGIPGFDAAGVTIVSIGNLPGVQNGTVLMNVPPAGSLSVDQLFISSGMTLDTDGGEIGTLTGSASLTGQNSTLIIRPSPGPNFHDMTTLQFTMGAGTLLNMIDGGRLRTSAMTSSGVITGRGTLHLQGWGPASTMINNGTISGGGNGGLVLLQEAAGRIDLDGTTGNGEIALTTPFSQLTITGDAPFDAFSGSVFMGSGSLLTMNMSNGWSADSNSTFNITSALAGAAAQIDGGHLTFGGDLNIGGAHGRLRVLADLTLATSADVFLGSSDVLELDGETIVNGGIYQLSQGARIDFDGPTLMKGGTFSMAGPMLQDGVVNFNDQSEWSGTVTFSGTARVNDIATVSGATVINAGTLDMDGELGSTPWFIEHSLAINADRLTTSPAPGNPVGSMFHIGGGIPAVLVVNLSDPNDAWRMGGVMELNGIGALPVNRVAGSLVHFDGALIVNNGTSVVIADAAFHAGSVSIANGSTLRLRGRTSVDAAASFMGSGTLHNGVNGDMVLHSGVDLKQVGLLNSARLRIGESGAGIATVGRFVSSASADWQVDIGGIVPAVQFDRLKVSGDVTLAGTLSVQRTDGFVPDPGAIFEILSWTGTRTGTFSTVTSCDGAEVIYGRNSVWVRFNAAPGIPGDLNHDGVVDGADVGILLGHWGLCADLCCPADLNGDGIVDGADLGIVLGHWTA